VVFGVRQAYFEVKVVSPLARSYANLTAAALFRMAEKSKNREYKERIREVEHGDFNRGLAPQSSIVVKRIAEKLSEKQSINMSVVSGWLRCRLSFALLRTTILCVRGTRRKRYNSHENNIELSVSEAKITY
jgi:hypothetical protein